MHEHPSKHRPSIRELSKTPSWVMLGFIVGALFVLALPRPAPAPQPTFVARPAPPKPAPTAPRLLTTIEAVFDQWHEYAVWSDDRTQVALWNSAVGDFVECYDVLRQDGRYYFRSIPQLTHRVLRHGKQPPAECPLLFTETDEQYQDWRKYDRYERPMQDVRPSLSVPAPHPAAPQPSLDATPLPPPAPSVERKPEVVPSK